MSKVLGSKKGLYQLFLLLPSSILLQVGRLGAFTFPSGYYVYTGSAMGGILPRLSHHFTTVQRGPTRPYWHIDYLLQHCRIVGVVLYLTSCKGECELNQALLQCFGASVPAPGFGSSDCQCSAHLLYLGALRGPVKAGDADPSDRSLKGCGAEGEYPNERLIQSDAQGTMASNDASRTC